MSPILRRCVSGATDGHLLAPGLSILAQDCCSVVLPCDVISETALPSAGPKRRAFLICFAGFCQRLLTDLGSSSSSSISDLLPAIFEPYFSHVASFGDYVQRHLLKELEGIPLSHADDIDAARLLSDSIARVVVLAKQGILTE